MKTKSKIWFPWIAVPLGGLLVLGLTFFGYLLVYLSIEALFFSANPQAMDTGLVRRGFMLFIVVVYLLLELTKIPKLIKAVILVGPYAMLLVTIFLQFYEQLSAALLITVILTAFSAGLVKITKRPWYYYLALGVAVSGALFYGWPR